jgi:hypothetical protein
VGHGAGALKKSKGCREGQVIISWQDGDRQEKKESWEGWLELPEFLWLIQIGKVRRSSKLTQLRHKRHPPSGQLKWFGSSCQMKKPCKKRLSLLTHHERKGKKIYPIPLQVVDW